ncbi:MAG: TlpA family protein disulfide reductase [Ruminiclostridium sp.]|nr:TlpA family protein disulfide reductase [Ruminiclostridium sp.]
MKLNKFLTAAISAVLISVILASCTARKSEESDYMGSIASSDSAQTDAPENKSGITSPNSFTAVTLDGGEYTADDFSEADVTVINIWSTTCGPCIREMPEIAEYEKTLPDNVKLITWCLDGAYDSEYTKELLSSLGYEGITLIGGDGDLEKMYFDIMYTPTTLFVDSDGNIVGEALIGSPEKLAETYTELINKTLKALGKEEMK